MTQTKYHGADWTRIKLYKHRRRHKLAPIVKWCNEHESRYMWSWDFAMDSAVFYFQGKKDAVIFQLLFG